MNMSGGASSKAGYRYEEWCAMYFALAGFRDHKKDEFEYIRCEQDKLDFEIWHKSSFHGYQVKSNPTTLSAKEANAIFLDYFKKAKESKKNSIGFKFIFLGEPRNSLLHLLLKCAENSGITSYNARTAKYISTALESVDYESFKIDYEQYSNEHIESLVFSACHLLIQDKLRTPEQDIHASSINLFVTYLRDEIDRASCDPEEMKRTVNQQKVEEMIQRFLNNIRITNYTESHDISIKTVIRSDSAEEPNARTQPNLKPIGLGVENDRY